MRLRRTLAVWGSAMVLVVLTAGGCPKPPSAVPPDTGQAATGQATPASPAPATANQQVAAVNPAPQAETTQAAPTTGEAPTGKASQDWPAFRGATGDGISPLRGINKNWSSKPPKVLWQIKMSDRGYAGPSVAEGKVFILDHTGDQDIVRALDLRTGKDLWTHQYQQPSKYDHGYSHATPVYCDRRLYTLGRLGLLNCLDVRSGAKLWSVDLVSDLKGKHPTWGYAGPPIIDGEKLVVGTGGTAGLAALDRKTGKMLWTGGVGGLAGYGPPMKATISGKTQYVVFGGSCVYGADAASGKVLWQTPWSTSYDVNASTPVVAGNFVFITSGYGTGCELVKVSGSQAEVAWKSKDMQSHFNSPVYLDGYLYGTSDPGNLVCMSIKDGRVAWKQSGFEKGGVAAVDGTIIAVDGRGGDVVMVSASPSGYKELGRFKPLGGQSWSPPVIADGKLLIRNTTALACLDLK